jgi:tripartite-type tricarboxylate transporter receptor subunit TctC
VPQAVLDRLDVALGAVLAEEDTRMRLAAIGLEPAQSDARRFRAHVAGELERWARLVREAGIRSD